MSTYPTTKVMHPLAQEVKKTYFKRCLDPIPEQQLPRCWTSRQRALICKYIVNPFIDDINRYAMGAESAIEVLEDDEVRTVEVLSSMLFQVNKNTGVVKVYTRRVQGNYLLQENVVVDLPLRLRGKWLESRLFCRSHIFPIFKPEIGNVKVWQFEPVIQKLATLIHDVSHWRRLRHDLRDNIGLDRELLRSLRQGKTKTAQFLVTDLEYNRALPYLRDYRQLMKDSPQLIWVLNLLVDGEFLQLVDDEANCSPLTSSQAILKRMKLAFKKMKLGDSSWRLILNSYAADFHHIVYLREGEASSRTKWVKLCEWLKLLRFLGRDSPLPEKVNELFLSADWSFKENDDFVTFQSTQIPKLCFRHIFKQAMLHETAGTFQQFLDEELVDVVTWFAQMKEPLSRPRKSLGFNWMLREAKNWKQEEMLHANLSGQRWCTKLPTFNLGKWRIEPLTSAWQLRKHALEMRNCVDTFVAECKGNECRIFAVHNEYGKPVATLGYRFEIDEWLPLGVKGFANNEASTDAKRLETIVHGLHKLFC